MATIPTTEAWCASQLRRQAIGVAGRLRAMADEVDRDIGKLERVGQPGVPNYAAVATSIQQHVLSPLGQLGLDRLTEWSAEADVARATETTEARS